MLENQTLTQDQIDGLHPRRYGGKLRCLCPWYGGKDRSLEVDPETGRFRCHYCQSWGYTKESREGYGRDREKRPQDAPRPRGGSQREPPKVEQFKGVSSTMSPSEVQDRLREYQKLLPESLGEAYLTKRKIPQ